MKTGTSYIQRVLGRNRARLRDDGVLFPGRAWRDQVAAVRDVMDLRLHGHFDESFRGSWGGLVEEVHGWTGRAAVVSMEFLSFAEPAKAREIVNSLAPAEVRVVLAVRDLARVIPASWQETMQNWHTWTWEEYLEEIMADPPPRTDAGRDFWKQQDIPRMLRTWGTAVPADRIFVVTLPPSGSSSDLLWQRFCTVLDIDPRGYDMRLGGQNESLGIASAELMRRINLASQEQVKVWPAYAQTLKRGLAKNTLARRKSMEPGLGLPVAYHERIVDRAKRLVDEIEAFSPRIVGSLDELLPTNIADGAQPKDLTDSELLGAALHGIAGVPNYIYSEFETVHAERERAALRLQELEEQTPWQLFKRAVVMLAKRHRSTRPILGLYRMVKRRLV